MGRALWCGEGFEPLCFRSLDDHGMRTGDRMLIICVRVDGMKNVEAVVAGVVSAAHAVASAMCSSLLGCE